MAGTHLKAVSTCQKKTLEPSYKEVFEVPLPTGPEGTTWQLLCVCEDVDEITSADFMGSVAVPLEPLKDHKVSKQWYTLDKAGGKSDNISGEVELVLQWR